MIDEKALRHAMLDADCTVKELAKVCEISVSALYARLNGKVSFMTDEILRIKDHLNLTWPQCNAIFFVQKVS